LHNVSDEKLSGGLGTRLTVHILIPNVASFPGSCFIQLHKGKVHKAGIGNKAN